MVQNCLEWGNYHKKLTEALRTSLNASKLVNREGAFLSRYQVEGTLVFGINTKTFNVHAWNHCTLLGST